MRVPSQTSTPNFLNSLGESGLKLSVVDEGSFVRWLGQGDRYDAFSSIVVVSYNIIVLSRFTGEEFPCLEDLIKRIYVEKKARIFMP